MNLRMPNIIFGLTVLFITAVMGGMTEPPPVGVIGILGVAVSLGIMVFGAWRTRSPQIAE